MSLSLRCFFLGHTMRTETRTEWCTTVTAQTCVRCGSGSHTRAPEPGHRWPDEWRQDGCVRTRACLVCELPQTWQLHVYRPRRIADLTGGEHDRAIAASAGYVYHEKIGEPCLWAEICDACGDARDVTARHDLPPRRHRDDNLVCATPECGYIDWGHDGDID